MDERPLVGRALVGRPLAERPPWLRKRAPKPEDLAKMHALMSGLKLNTVCREAVCPNQGECFARRTATFLLLGDICTRNCAFCAVRKASVPVSPDPAEPTRVAEAVSTLGLKHVVLTSVTRDDLSDGGAGHFALTITEIRKVCPGTTIEVLIPDLGGSGEALDVILDASPEVLGHNLETVPRLYSRVRPKASYTRSLALLATVKEAVPNILTKSGLMVGLGESPSEVESVMKDLRLSNCDFVTLGQYLAPAPGNLPVVEYVSPTQFQGYREAGIRMGFLEVLSGPFVRSSYCAGDLLDFRSDGRRRNIV